MRRTVILLVTVFVRFSTALAAGQAPEISPEQRQEFQNYQLTLSRANHLITAMEAMTKYVVALPNFKELMLKSTKMTPAERREQLEKDPKAMAILKQNGLTAQDYIVGVPALRMALMVAQGLPTGPRIIASPANVAFAKANLAELKSKMEAAEGIAAKK
jgi:hypothetical protein